MSGWYLTVSKVLTGLACAVLIKAASDEFSDSLHDKWGSDWPFSGIATFAHLDHLRCLTEPDVSFDIGIIGAPFDTATGYRPGARFGPRAIRVSSARQSSIRSFNYRAGVNPYTDWAKVVDCGDIPVTPFDNALGLRQMTEAFTELGHRTTRWSKLSGYRSKPKILTLGGDHSILLPILRALHSVYKEPISVLHFDAHMDTRNPSKYLSAWMNTDGTMAQSYFNHGSMLWIASTEGLIANGTSVHAGLRARIAGNDYSDFDDDTDQGWHRIMVDDLDDVGSAGIVDTIRSRIGLDVPVYMSVDIDVLDPSTAPGTGTPEPGGWTTRELLRILRGLEDLNLIGADVVEVSPSYDGAEVTSLAASQIVFEILTNMVKRGRRENTTESSRGLRNAKDEL